MRIVLETRRCIGAAACVMAAEDVFALSDEGVVDLLGQPDAAAEARARQAAAACPTGAIVVVED
jgi:ferredoxin